MLAGVIISTSNSFQATLSARYTALETLISHQLRKGSDCHRSDWRSFIAEEVNDIRHDAVQDSFVGQQTGQIQKLLHALNDTRRSQTISDVGCGET